MHITSLPSFIEGQTYSRVKDIHTPFGGNRQSGISWSGTHPAIFIFSSGSGDKFGYQDAWHDDGRIYTYTGEGQIGDMTFSKGNLAIRDHVINGRSLFLFKLLQRKGGLYTYEGEMECLATHSSMGPDRDGTFRRIIQFQLAKIQSNQSTEANEIAYSIPSRTLPTSLKELRQAAEDALKPATEMLPPKETRRALYQRSRQVINYALARAAGCCESCGKEAPFQNAHGMPYLEVHHLDRVSDGGLDKTDKVAAICPNCHRHIHSGMDGSEKNLALKIFISKLENELKNGA